MRERVIERMDNLGLTPTELARKIGVNQSTIHSLVSGRTKTYRQLDKLADGLHTSVGYLLGEDDLGLHKDFIKIRSHAPAVQFGPDTIPILGHANGSSEAVMINSDNEIGRALRHPNQQGLKNAFALYAQGESMSPRYEAGDLIYVASDKPPSPGQDCIVEMHNGEGFLKKFVRRTEGELICRQLNPEKQWKKPLSEVKAIHAVVGRG